MKAVMMVAGKSTRTYPLTLTRPKPLLPILNKPLIYYNLDQLVGLVDEVIVIVGYRKEMIFANLGYEYKGIKIVHQEQKLQLGTGHAVLQAAPHINEAFLVMNGDDLFSKEDIQKLLSFQFAALAQPVSDPSLYGVFQVNEHNQVIRLVEKPKEKIGNLANVGCYLFQPHIFSILEKLEHYEPQSMLGQPPLIWDRAEGFQVFDRWGNAWIDWSSGVLITNAGHAHPLILEALQKLIDQKRLLP